MPRIVRTLLAPCRVIASWFHNHTDLTAAPDRVDWMRAVPFLLMHVACLAALWVGFSATAVVVALGLYFLRMFAVTAFYHRYFSHRAFKTWRWSQFLFGVLGCSAVQRGPLWWAAHHRHHHRHSDGAEDVHSPVQRGFWWSHLGWFLSPRAKPTHLHMIPDLTKFPELRLLERLELLVPVFFAACIFGLGEWLAHQFPDLGTSGWQLLVWGFFISTVLVYHATYLVNSMAHRVGSRRYATTDDSRNNFWLALLTLGEGWHNNHHHYQSSARQGFRWWEVDLTYYVLVALSWVGLVWELRPVPKKVLHNNLIDQGSSVDAQENPEVSLLSDTLGPVTLANSKEALSSVP